MATSSAEAQSDRVDFVILNTRLFDGFAWRNDATIVVDGHRIVDVTTGETRTRGAVELDGRHWIVVPGLIDAHVHVLDSRSETATPRRIAERLRSLLGAGVTTIQSTSDPTAEIISLRSRIASGLVESPRLFTTGAQIAAVGGPKTFRCGPDTVRCQVEEVANTADIERVVAHLAAAKVDAVKFVVDHRHAKTLSIPLACATIEAARSYGLRTLGHFDRAADAQAAVGCGLDAILHPVPWRSGSANEIAAFLAQEGVPLTSTLSLRSPYVAGGSSVTMVGGRPYPADRYRLLQHALRVVRALHDAGGVVALGTDAALAWSGPSPSEMYMRELQLLVEAGLSTTQALQAATRNAATHIGVDDLGSVTPGARADLVILGRDPADNVANLESVLIVVKDGQIVVDNREPLG